MRKHELFVGVFYSIIEKIVVSDVSSIFDHNNSQVALV